SYGVFLNDVRVTTSGAAVLSGSKLSLGQEGAVMKLLVPGQPSKTTQGMQAAEVQAAAAPGPVARAPESKPAPTPPAPSPSPAATAQPAPDAPAPRQSSDSARRG